MATPKNDAWDWAVLMYVATVILGRSEAAFWRMTPRKLNALTNVHIEFNGGNKEKVDEAFKPTSFVDKVF